MHHYQCKFTIFVDMKANIKETTEDVVNWLLTEYDRELGDKSLDEITEVVTKCVEYAAQEDYVWNDGDIDDFDFFEARSRRYSYDVLIGD